jgi:glutamate-1-semialdehyde 2,1-aminomutase
MTMHRIAEAYLAARPKSQALWARARTLLGGGVGHDLRHHAPLPLYISHGRGGRKWDVDGHEYIDFLLGNGALLLGHADPEIGEAVAAALARGTHFGSDHELQMEWAEWVCRLLPCAERVRFVNSGTEATALALRLARAYTGRSKVLRFEGHFHGWHDEVVHGFAPPFEADGSLGVPAKVREQVVMLPDGDLERVASCLASDGEVAGMILEPSGASWGRVPIERAFLAGLRELADRHGVLLIFDEVVTGFRFAPGGAQQFYGVTPDLACLAKVLAGGMPGGAVAGRAEILDLFRFTGDPQHDRHRRVVHLGTFNAFPLSAAAGTAALRRIATGEPTARANALAAQLRQRWDQVLEAQGIAGYVYGEASTFHVYFETDQHRVRAAGKRAALVTRDARRLKGMPSELVAQYQQQLRFRGVDVMSSTGGVLSAAHTETDVQQATEAFEAAVKALREDGLVLCLD